MEEDLAGDMGEVLAEDMGEVLVEVELGDMVGAVLLADTLAATVGVIEVALMDTEEA